MVAGVLLLVRNVLLFPQLFEGNSLPSQLLYWPHSETFRWLFAASQKHDHLSSATF